VVAPLWHAPSFLSLAIDGLRAGTSIMWYMQHSTCAHVCTYTHTCTHQRGHEGKGCASPHAILPPCPALVCRCSLPVPCRVVRDHRNDRSKHGWAAWPAALPVYPAFCSCCIVGRASQAVPGEWWGLRACVEPACTALSVGNAEMGLDNVRHVNHRTWRIPEIALTCGGHATPFPARWLPSKAPTSNTTYSLGWIFS